MICALEADVLQRAVTAHPAITGWSNGLYDGPFSTSAPPCCQPLLTIDLEGIICLELSGCRLTEHREHVHKVVEGEIPLAILRESLHDPLLEGILLKTSRAITEVVRQGLRTSLKAACENMRV